MSIRAIVVGWLVSYMGQMVVNKPVLVGFVLAAMGGSTDTGKLTQVMADLRTSAPLHVIQLVTQTIATIAGAYVAVQIAKRSPLKHSLALGLLVLISTTLFALDTLRVWPIWYSVLSLLLPVPTAWLGGRWSADKMKTRAPVSAGNPPIPAP